MSAHDYRRFAAGRKRRRGMVLVLVLVVIALLILAGLALSQWMVAERMATQVSGRQVQARALAESAWRGPDSSWGDRQRSKTRRADGTTTPERFRDVLVLDGELPLDRGRFTILAPRIEDRAVTGVRYGVEDEVPAHQSLDPAGRGRAAGRRRKMLLGLPGMTESIADAILDWLDADDDLREFGAEADYYSSLSPGYAPRNGPPARSKSCCWSAA